MRNFNAAISGELSKEVLHMFFMLELQTSVPQYYTDSDIDVFDSSHNRFISRGFSFGEIKGSTTLAVETMEIEIDDTDQVLSSVLLNEDVRNKVAILYFGVITRDLVAGIEWATGIEWGKEGAPVDIMWDAEHYQSRVETQEIIRGFIGGWELFDDTKAKVTITNELILWNKRSLRTAQSSCPWIFKGGTDNPECGYSGLETQCDQSWENCKDLGNDENFGGNRFLPALMEKKIWWGSKSAN